MTTYDFNVQRAIGEEGEGFLDRFFEPRYIITPATRDEQRMDIDRHFEKRETGSAFTIEYKTDDLAKKYRNAFIETISVDTHGKPGWAVMSAADFLIYYVTGDEIIYVIRFADLRKRIPYWAFRYKPKDSQNKGYKTWGIPVPLHELERIACEVYTV